MICSKDLRDLHLRKAASQQFEAADAPEGVAETGLKSADDLVDCLRYLATIFVDGTVLLLIENTFSTNISPHILV